MEQKPSVEELARTIKEGMTGVISDPKLIRVREAADAGLAEMSAQARDARVAVAIDLRSLFHEGMLNDVRQMDVLERKLKQAINTPGVLQNTGTAGHIGVESANGATVVYAPDKETVTRIVEKGLQIQRSERMGEGLMAGLTARSR